MLSGQRDGVLEKGKLWLKKIWHVRKR